MAPQHLVQESSPIMAEKIGEHRVRISQDPPESLVLSHGVSSSAYPIDI